MRGSVGVPAGPALFLVWTQERTNEQETATSTSPLRAPTADAKATKSFSQVDLLLQSIAQRHERGGFRPGNASLNLSRPPAGRNPKARRDECVGFGVACDPHARQGVLERGVKSFLGSVRIRILTRGVWPTVLSRAK